MGREPSDLQRWVVERGPLNVDDHRWLDQKAMNADGQLTVASIHPDVIAANLVVAEENVRGGSPRQRAMAGLLWKNSGLGLHEIAVRSDASPTTVHRWIRRHERDLRESPGYSAAVQKSVRLAANQMERDLLAK